MIAATNIVWHDSAVSKQQRRDQAKHTSCIVWFTGLSGSGKSTLSVALEQYLFERNYRVYRLDGDNIRHGLNSDLGFSAADRTENIRRIGEVAKLLVDSGTIAMTAFISPYQADRDLVRAMVEPGEFIEVYVECSLATCEQRDTKGLYAKARAGTIPEFTGISAPYEAPIAPDITINTERQTVEPALAELVHQLQQRGVLRAA
ncbi:MAG: adenylyl-sulfate kinase [Candidatus Kerfeldbacteria bacterium]|nr:adenylyl-sulfate kinase [Candidatus Kerfeldbacteria bacterium]